MPNQLKAIGGKGLSLKARHRDLGCEYAIAAGMLRRIKGIVRYLDEIEHRIHPRAYLCDSDADRRTDCLRSNRKIQGLDLSSKPLGNLLGLGHFRFRQQKQELFTAKTRHHVRLAS